MNLKIEPPPYEQILWNYTNKIWGGSMVQQQILKGEAGPFPIKFFQGLSFLQLEITLSFAKLRYTLHYAAIIL